MKRFINEGGVGDRHAGSAGRHAERSEASQTMSHQAVVMLNAVKHLKQFLVMLNAVKHLKL
jgi:hypothetical protein